MSSQAPVAAVASCADSNNNSGVELHIVEQGTGGAAYQIEPHQS